MLASPVVSSSSSSSSSTSSTRTGYQPHTPVGTPPPSLQLQDDEDDDDDTQTDNSSLASLASLASTNVDQTMWEWGWPMDAVNSIEHGATEAVTGQGEVGRNALVGPWFVYDGVMYRTRDVSTLLSKAHKHISSHVLNEPAGHHRTARRAFDRLFLALTGNLLPEPPLVNEPDLRAAWRVASYVMYPVLGARCVEDNGDKDWAKALITESPTGRHAHRVSTLVARNTRALISDLFGNVPGRRQDLSPYTNNCVSALFGTDGVIRLLFTDPPLSY